MLSPVYLAAIIIAASPIAGWHTISTEHFDLRYPPEALTMAQNLKPRLEPTLERVLADLGANFEDKITVILAPDDATFFKLQGPSVPDWASGTAYPSQRLIYLKPLTANEIRHRSLVNVLGHEISHVVLPYRLKGRRAPRWLDEGIAVHQAREFMLDRSNQLLTVGITGRHIPFESLSNGFPRSGNSAAVAYAQSTSMVSFIVNEYGIDSFHALLDEFAESGDFDEAVDAALDTSLPELEGIWLKHVRFYYGIVSLVTSSLFLWFAISILFLWAYIRKKRRSELRKQMWDLQEEYENLPDDLPTYH